MDLRAFSAPRPSAEPRNAGFGIRFRFEIEHLANPRCLLLSQQSRNAKRINSLGDSRRQLRDAVKARS
jgi:hypothetical protein